MRTYLLLMVCLMFASGCKKEIYEIKNLEVDSSTDRVENPEFVGLQALYHSLGGDRWHQNTNWLSDKPFASWHGIRVDEKGHVIAISLPRNNLTGQLPETINKLLHLRHLLLHGNSDLYGPIPKTLNEMKTLETVFFFETQIEDWTTDEIRVDI